MNAFTAAILGTIQGLTEFLPVSSSGHLVLAQNLIPGFSQPGILFDVVLHFGTLFAVLIFFKDRIFKLSKKYIGFLIVGTIPAVLVGLLFKNRVEALFVGGKIVGIELIISGLINLWIDKISAKDESLDNKKSWWIGIAQAVAIIPGISRSGATIFAGVKQGVDPKEAAEFSFILSVPAILGANLLEFLGRGIGGEANLAYYSLGFVAAFLSGLLAIKVVFDFLKKKRFEIFAYYCFIIGVLAIILL